MISIIIPNYNGYKHLETCFNSLKSQIYSEYEIILVDNGSSDESIHFTKSVFPDAKIITNSENLGFAKAVNQGIEQVLKSTSEFIMLLNNDIELKADFISVVMETFRQQKNASMIAVKMMNYYNRDILDDCGDFIKRNGGSPYARGHAEKDTSQYDKEEYIFGACAGAAIYRKEIFQKVGLFDTTFFAYYEDIDFSFRAQLSGFKCFYQPRAVCYHKRGGTSSIATHGFQTKMCEKNLVMLRFKNYPLSVYLLYQPLFFIARIKRYYSFIRFHSIGIFLKALSGYINGIILLPFKIPERLRIQKNRTVSSKYIVSLFTD